MNSKNEHTIDTIFILGLVVIFAISALSVVYIGFHIYQETVESMEKNFNNNTAMDYIVEKVRQGDSSSVQSIDGVDVLAIREKENNEIYVTYIYVENHHLMETLMNQNDSFHLGQGDIIMDVSSLQLQIKDSLLKISLTLHNEKETSYVSLKGGDE